MRKTTIALAVAIASLSTVAVAAPESGTFYLGGEVGWSSFYGLNDKSDISATDVFNHKSNDRVGGGAYLGYQANPYLAFELGYDWLGDANYRKSDIAGDDTFGGKFRSQGADVVAKLSYPIYNNIDIYTRLGAFIYHNKLKSAITNESGSKTGVAPLAALGLQYDINDMFSTRLDYQWVNEMKTNKDTSMGEKIKPDNGLLSVGVSYNFANIAKKAAPEPAPEVIEEVEIKETKFVLSDDVLFDFGKSELKAGGKEQLNELLTKLVRMQPSQGTAVVVGYTDRIGSAASNEKLSLRRATAVMDYLVQNGVPRDAITARGAGSTNSITGSKCNGLSGNNLKSCLAPDRRVEIEISGVRQEEEIREVIAE